MKEMDIIEQMAIVLAAIRITIIVSIAIRVLFASFIKAIIIKVIIMSMVAFKPVAKVKLIANCIAN